MEKNRHEFLYELYNQLAQDKLSLFYLGKFDDELTDLIMQVQESSSYGDYAFRKIEKKAGYLMAECFQNVIRHGNGVQVDEDDAQNKFFLIRSLPKSFQVTSGNLVNKESRRQLEEILGKIEKNSLTDLRKIYLEILSSGEFSEQGGAGLGLIDIARKTGKNLEHSFVSHTDEASFFIIQIVLEIFNAQKEGSSYANQLALTTEWYKFLSNNGYLMLFKGDFSHESLMTILSMFENNITEKNKKEKKISFYLALEMLQNINKHAESQMQIGKPGIFGIGVDQGKFFLESGNFIHSKNKNSLENFLNYLNQSSKEDLNNLYKKILVEKEPGFKGSAGLGFIDIARMSSEPINFTFTPIDQDYYFFQMLVKP